MTEQEKFNTYSNRNEIRRAINPSSADAEFADEQLEALPGLHRIVFGFSYKVDGLETGAKDLCLYKDRIIDDEQISDNEGVVSFGNKAKLIRELYDVQQKFVSFLKVVDSVADVGVSLHKFCLDSADSSKDELDKSTTNSKEQPAIVSDKILATYVADMNNHISRINHLTTLELNNLIQFINLLMLDANVEGTDID